MKSVDSICNRIEQIELLHKLHTCIEKTHNLLSLLHSEADTMAAAHSTSATLGFSHATLRKTVDPVHEVEVHWKRSAVSLPGFQGVRSPTWDWKCARHNTTVSI